VSGDKPTLLPGWSWKSSEDDSQTSGAERFSIGFDRLAALGGLCAPGLRQEGLIRKLCDASLLPVNIMIYADTFARGQLAAWGVSQISYGAVPYGAMLAFLKADAERALADAN